MGFGKWFLQLILEIEQLLVELLTWYGLSMFCLLLLRAIFLFNLFSVCLCFSLSSSDYMICWDIVHI